MSDNNNNNNYNPPTPCPRSCPCPIVLDIATSIAHMEDALACILNAECAKLNKVINHTDDSKSLISINSSVQTTLAQVTELENALKDKLDSIIPLLLECM